MITKTELEVNKHSNVVITPPFYFLLNYNLDTELLYYLNSILQIWPFELFLIKKNGSFKPPFLIQIIKHLILQGLRQKTQHWYIHSEHHLNLQTYQSFLRFVLPDQHQ